LPGADKDLSERSRRVLDAVPKRLLVGGEWRDASSGAVFSVEDPATNESLCSVADGGVEDAVRALEAAAAAQDRWASTAPRERSAILMRAWQRLVDSREDLALLMTLEMGKPLAESEAEVVYAAEFLRWFSEEAPRVYGRWSVSPPGGARLLTMRQPVGPCLLITPWNFPMAMATRKVAPALAAGCTMVVKPAELAPLSTLALAAVLEECGLPAGVLNVVTTTSAPETAGAILADPRLRKLSFTGSTEVGKRLMSQASESVLRISLELGGNAAFLVFEDADVDAALEGALIAKMRNIGESCVAANRFLVHAAVAERFTSELSERMNALKVGRGTDDGVSVGPLIDERQRSKVSALVGDAVDRGSRVLSGGHSLEGPGYFFEPTVLAGVTPAARLLHEEVFGPVAPVTTFSSEEEAVRAANATPHGLVAYLYTRSLERAVRVSEALEVGMVGLNRGLVSNPAAPFGGVKQSGIGREGGPEGIEEYLYTKYVALQA
jgi:succinate-semialdehyde dehydrogenase/glutarate-semialdehyde dehydrogenase